MEKVDHVLSIHRPTFGIVKNARYIAEFLGTLFLVLIIRLSTTVGPEDNTYQSFAIGFGLIAIIYQYGWISKAHYNPAVTIAFAIRGNVPVFHSTDYGQILMYLFVEFFGAFLGALCGDVIIAGKDDFDSDINPCPTGPFIDTDKYTLTQGFFSEFLFTFYLVFVILHVGTYQDNNQHYGIAIGFTVFASILCIGNITGSVLNPSVWFGLHMASLVCNDNDNNDQDRHLDQIWVYFISEFLAAIVSGLMFRYLFEPAGMEMNENKSLIDPSDSDGRGLIRRLTNKQRSRSISKVGAVSPRPNEVKVSTSGGLGATDRIGNKTGHVRDGSGTDVALTSTN